MSKRIDDMFVETFGDVFSEFPIGSPQIKVISPSQLSDGPSALLGVLFRNAQVDEDFSMRGSYILTPKEIEETVKQIREAKEEFMKSKIKQVQEIQEQPNNVPVKNASEMKFLHIRAYDEYGEVQPRGGVTVAYRQVEGDVFFSLASCSITEQFNRKTGRQIAVDRFNRGELTKINIAAFSRVRGLKNLSAADVLLTMFHG